MSAHDDYAPPYLAAVAGYKPDVKQVVMAYFGVQYLSESLPHAADKALKSIAHDLTWIISQHQSCSWVFERGELDEDACII